MSYDQNSFSPLPPLPPAPPQKSGNWVVRHKVISGGIAAFAGLAILGAIVGGGSEKELATQASNGSASTVDQATIDKAVADALAKQAASPTPAPTPAATPAATPVADPTSTPDPTPEADDSAVNFSMPNFVGMNLQDAQDKVQTYGIFYSTSHDLNGSRMQILDSNWKVCDQNIKPGTKIKGPAGDYEGKIDFGTVKIAEDCP